MKRITAFTALLLLFLMLLTACGKEEPVTLTETKEETSSVSSVELTDADREYLKKYLADYEAGTYEGKKLFEYESFEEFIKPFEYKGLTYPADSMIDDTVTDEDVEEYLTLFLLATKVSDDQYETLSEGVVQKYDVTTIDFRGVVDGVESEQASGTDQELVIGSNTFIDGFESGLVGAKIGEEVRLDMRFSPYYGSEDVAGKPVTFYVTVKSIKRPAIPQLTAEDVNAYYSTDFKTVEETKTWFKEALGVQEKNSVYTTLSAYLQEKIMDSMEVVEYPRVEMEHFSSLYMLQHEYAKGDSDWEAYCSEKLGSSYEQLQKDAEEYAKEQVKPLLMMYYIEKEEGLTCTTEQIGSFIEGFYTSQNSDGYYKNLQSMVEECTEFYGADFFEQQVIGAMASEKIIEYAVKEAV